MRLVNLRLSRAAGARQNQRGAQGSKSRKVARWSTAIAQSWLFVGCEVGMRLCTAALSFRKLSAKDCDAAAPRFTSKYRLEQVLLVSILKGKAAPE